MANPTVKQQLKELETLLAASQKHDKGKADYEGVPGALSVNGRGKWTFDEITNFMGQQATERHSGMNIEQHALRQLLGRLSVPFFGKGSGATMDSLDWETMLNRYPGQFAAIVNDLLPQIESKGLLVRTHKKDIRGIMTDRYSVVDNTAVLGAAYDILSEAAHDLRDLRVVNSQVSRDRLDLRVVFSEPEVKNPEPMSQGATRRNDPRSGRPYGVGVFVSNEETGRGGLKVQALIWRGQCTNSIIIDTAQSVALRHIGQPAALFGRLKQAMVDTLPVSGNTLNRVYEATNKDIPNLADVVTGLAKDFNWSDDTTKQVLIGTEGQETVMGLVNGVSYAASLIDVSASRVEMETQAGQILVAPDSLFAKAARMVSERAERK